MFIEEKRDINSDILESTSMEDNTEINESTNHRPPERDIRESQPTISVNYRVIKQNNSEVNDIDEGYRNNKYDDWEEIESNW